MPGRTITHAYTCLYRGTGQMSAYVKWSDGSHTEGRAEGPLRPIGLHMRELFRRAEREGRPITHEVW